MLDLYAAATTAAASVRARTAHQPRLGLVLGSGLGRLGEEVAEAITIPYAEIPGLAPTSVGGHAGRLVLGRLADQPVAVLQGRLHLYEGHAPSRVVLPLLLLWQLGITGIILTNAAGGINPAFGEGALMLITDHINLTGLSPLTGAEDARLGGRFVDLSAAYDPAWRALAQRVAGTVGVPLHEGVYLGVGGPHFETPAEIRAFARLGADAVGMSTVLETIMARAVGLRVLGLSCITNLAAGLGGPISHEEVGRVANRVSDQFMALVHGIIAAYGDIDNPPTPPQPPQ